MIQYFKDNELDISSDVEPIIVVRAFSPDDTKEVRRDKKRKPYLLKNKVEFRINTGKEHITLPFSCSYTWDGASVPFLFRPLIGKKGSLEFLLPSMVHDKMCENRELVNNNRNLSSRVFRALLISTGVGKIRANIMYHAVDNYQKLKSWN